MEYTVSFILAALTVIAFAVIFFLYKKTGAQRPEFLHITSMFVTGICSVAAIFLVNSVLFDILGSRKITWAPLKSFFSGPAGYLAASRCFLFTLAIIIVFLLAVNGIIYRHVYKKIFEHYSIVFTAAGGITLLFMLAYSDKVLYFITGSVLILAGAVLMLIYGAAYHALNKKEQLSSKQ